MLIPILNLPFLNCHPIREDILDSYLKCHLCFRLTASYFFRALITTWDICNIFLISGLLFPIIKAPGERGFCFFCSLLCLQHAEKCLITRHSINTSFNKYLLNESLGTQLMEGLRSLWLVLFVCLFLLAYCCGVKLGVIFWFLWTYWKYEDAGEGWE